MKSKINFILTTLLFLPLFVLAEDLTKFEPMVGIPGLEEEMDFAKYINALYIMSISIAAMIAVIKIIISGVKYMMTGLVDSKSEAVKDIRGALLGLIIIMSAVMVLEYINPNLTNSSIQLEPIPRTSSTANTETRDPAPAPLVGPMVGTNVCQPVSEGGSCSEHEAACTRVGGSLVNVRVADDGRKTVKCVPNTTITPTATNQTGGNNSNTRPSTPPATPVTPPVQTPTPSPTPSRGGGTVSLTCNNGDCLAAQATCRNIGTIVTTDATNNGQGVVVCTLNQ